MRLERSETEMSKAYRAVPADGAQQDAAHDQASHRSPSTRRAGRIRALHDGVERDRESGRGSRRRTRSMQFRPGPATPPR